MGGLRRLTCRAGAVGNPLLADFQRRPRMGIGWSGGLERFSGRGANHRHRRRARRLALGRAIRWDGPPRVHPSAHAGRWPELGTTGRAAGKRIYLPPHWPRFCRCVDGLDDRRVPLRCRRRRLAGGHARQQSYLYATTDGGVTWQTSAFPGGDLYLLDPNRGWALSTDIYWTEDGGATWTKIKTVDWEGQFSFVDAMAGWAVARSVDASALLRALDGGR